MKKAFLSFCAIAVLFAFVGCAPPAPSAERASTMPNPEMAIESKEDDFNAPIDDTTSSEKIGETVVGERKLIREANLGVEVEDVQSALNRATGLSVQMGGYTMQSNSWLIGEQQHIRFSFAVPVQRFEEALEQTRSLGVVQDESISTRDVTAQYVDVEARIENLEATTERVRSFLDDATDIEQTLAINRELTRLEGDLNSLKGQRNVLSRQTAFSTIHLELRPIPPERTTAEVLEDVTVWTPVKTFNDALAMLLSVLRVLGDLSIWLVIVGGPILFVLAIVWAILRYFFSRIRRSQKVTPSPPPMSDHE